MRPIKFRCWNTTSKTMYPLEHFALRLDGTLMQLMNDSLPYGDTAWNISQGAMVIMQYTGLHDKNGVEIYEGDICRQWDKDYFSTDKRHPNKILKVIKWNDSRPQFNFHNPSRLEVIGNIYENKDLLK